MQRHTRSFSRVVTLCAAVLCASQVLPCQVRADELVVASFAYPASRFPGYGGLFVVDPDANPPTVVPVSGLPCELTGACNPNQQWTGPDFVLRLPKTRALVTDGPSWVGQTLYAYVLTLNGTAVGSIAAYPLATYSSAGLGSPAAALLADDRVLLAIDPNSMSAPPLGGAVLGILDPTLLPTDPNSVTRVPVSPIPPGDTNALAVDRDAGVAYVAMGVDTTFSIYAIPVPGGGTPVLVGTVPGIVAGLIVESDGTLLAGGWVPGQPNQATLWRVDPTTGVVTPLPIVLGAGQVNGLWRDPVSGDLSLLHLYSGGAQLRRLTPAGTLSTLTAGPAGGWGAPAGIDGYARIEPFGGASGSPHRARWTLGPNPGGPVRLGNAGFTLTNPQPPGTALSVWVAGAGHLTPPLTLPVIAPTLLYVQPTLVMPILQGTLPLPIPADPRLAGSELYFQCLHWDGANVLSASSGLHLTL